MANENGHGDYIHGRGSVATDAMAVRSADKEAAFFLPFLESGMSVLDGGCGPGSITQGIARVVNPGQVTAIDISEGQIAIAADKAQQAGVMNITFQSGNLLELPFEDASFDAVFTHMVVEHIADSDRAFSEIFRVLKPGGFYGARHGVAGAKVLNPPTKIMEEMFRRRDVKWVAGSGDPNFVVVQSKKMADVGFEIESITSSTQHFGPREIALLGVEGQMAYFEPHAESQQEMDELRREIESNFGDPYALYVTLVMETVGRKPTAA
jgi:ubiquinone/menaquinone biosynthesis C-methylase UbiE